MGKHYTEEFKIKVLNEYKSGKYGGSDSVSKRNKISKSTLWKWIIKDRKYGSVINDIENNRGRSKEESIDYKERYKILKKYQAFIKAQREKK